VSKETEDARAAAGGEEAPAKAPKAEHPKDAGAPARPEGRGADAKADKGEKPPRAPKGEKPAKGESGGRRGGTRDEGEGKAKAPVVKDPPGYKPRLKVLFLEKVEKDLKEEFGYKSVMQIPRVSKIVVSTGLGEAITNKKLLDSAAAEIAQITGRRPVRTRAKKSIANFKVRKGMDLGVMVTLRGNVMYEFLDRLINAAMPRIKDFRGANPNAFDGHGNYSLGVTEQIIFPEIDYDKIERVSGMNIAVVTTARTDAEARSLLAGLGMPFRK
jgi:large subunit ribosomal protein L5